MNGLSNDVHTVYERLTDDLEVFQVTEFSAFLQFFSKCSAISSQKNTRISDFKCVQSQTDDRCWKMETCTSQRRWAANGWRRYRTDRFLQIYLGVKLNKTMDWSDHIDYIHSKVAKRLGLLEQLMLEKSCITPWSSQHKSTGTLSWVTDLIKQKWIHFKSYKTKQRNQS